MNKFFIKAGSVGAMLGVALGAFGAHALREFLELNQRGDTYETAIKYLFYHAIAMILVGILAKEFKGKTLLNAGWAFLIGTVIFSGSLFVLIATDIKIMGAITPLGGVSFIIGWILLFLAVVKQ